MAENKFSIDTSNGLSEEAASQRLQKFGYNELPSSKDRSVLMTAWDVVREPMFLLLLACGTIYLVLGDVQEALMLLGFVFVVLGITLYQERKTERALEALRDLSSPRALVIRSGERKRIAGREVVPDDLVVLAEGDRVPADSVVLSCNSLSTDESLLTGESVPVRKIVWDGIREMSRPAGEDHWPPHRNGQHRQGPPNRSGGRNPASERGRTIGPPSRHYWIDVVPHGHCCLRRHSR